MATNAKHVEPSFMPVPASAAGEGNALKALRKLRPRRCAGAGVRKQCVLACVISSCLLALLLAAGAGAAEPAVRFYEGSVTIPTYTHTARATEPPLFANSGLRGLYPFTTYLYPFRPDDPKPRAWRAVFLENEYLKLTYLPELGGRIFSVYDKLRGREMFYRNDVIKPAHYNPRNTWPQSGFELTGPYDAHMLALYGEPFWSHTLQRRPDGSVSLVLGEFDPVYHMKVNFTVTLHPGIAALEVGVFCYNRRDARMPQMLWVNAALPATPKTRFIYPMTRTIGHTTGEVADWPIYRGTDYSWDRNNQHMLGVFGIDIYDNFQGAYHFDLDYGVFRYADRRIVQGMKLWTFGYGPNAKNLERGYTDNAGPYVEVQSGRHVWDGHYEWVAPHRVESWDEWWIPVSGIGGVTTITRDLALRLEVAGSRVGLTLSAAREIPGAKISLTASGRQLLTASAGLAPGTPFRQSVQVGSAASLKRVVVQVTDANGRELLAYQRPDENPRRKQYTPFTRPLEEPQKAPEAMTVEELVSAAEFKLKELQNAAAVRLLETALKRDTGFSRAHLLLGINHFTAGRYPAAEEHLQKALERDPYLDEGCYYLALAQLAVGKEEQAERNLYYIWPNSAYFGEREYQLGRLALRRNDAAAAAVHLQRAVTANGLDLSARLLLAVIHRDRGEREAALRELAEIDRIDPANAEAPAERFLLTGAEGERAELLRLTGGQSQEAINVSSSYRSLGRWKDATRVLQTIERDNNDPFGTPAEFYYTLAYCLQQDGQTAEAASYWQRARSAAGNVDRFPYREESEAPLAAAIQADPNDALARFLLGCLLYYRERPSEAIGQWEEAVRAEPRHFSAHRALGLAYAEQGYGIQRAAGELEKAVDLNPDHARTLADLSTLYGKAGAFDRQAAVLQKALARSPSDDTLAEGLLAANIAIGRYDDATKLIGTHRFAPRHRSYGLRDEYRLLQFARGSRAFHAGQYEEALRYFQAGLAPPVSMGLDDFAGQTAPRLEYAIGRALEAMGRASEARQAYGRAAEFSGEPDTWSSEDFHTVLALEKLGRKGEAATLLRRSEALARDAFNAKSSGRRADARYMLALVEKHAGRHAEARKLMQDAILAQADALAPRLELRGDTLDRLR